MTIIVTGGSGFIGTNIMDYYLKKNLKIFNFDINPPQKKEHIEHWQKVDIANYKDICKLFKIGEPAFPKPITPIVMISLMISPFVI